MKATKQRKHIRVKQERPIKVGGKKLTHHRVSSAIAPIEEYQTPILDPITNDISYTHPRNINSVWLSNNIPGSVKELISDNSLFINPNKMKDKNKKDYLSYLIEPYLDRYTDEKDNWLFQHKEGNQKVINFSPQNINDFTVHTLNHTEITKVADKLLSISKLSAKDKERLEEAKTIATISNLYDKIISGAAVSLAKGNSMLMEGNKLQEFNIDSFIETTREIENLQAQIDQNNISGMVLTRKESKRLNKLIKLYNQKIDVLDMDLSSLVEVDAFLSGNIKIKSKADPIKILRILDDLMQKSIDTSSSEFNSIGAIRNPFTGTGDSVLAELLASFDETIDSMSQITKSRKYEGADTNDLSNHKEFDNMEEKIDRVANNYAQMISTFIQNDDFNNKLLDYTSYAHNRRGISRVDGKNVTNVHRNQAIVAGVVKPLLNRDLVNYVDRTNNWVDKSYSKGKRRTFRRVVYDGEENKYKAVLVVSGATGEHNITYNSKRDVISDPSLSPYLKKKIVEESKLSEFDINTIISGQSKFEDQVFGFSLSARESEQLQGVIYQLNYMGLDGVSLLNDYIQGIAEIEIDLVGSSNFRILTQLRTMYLSTQDEIIADSIHQMQIKYDAAGTIQKYPWDAIAGGKPSDIFLLENFNYRSQIQPDDTIQDLVKFGIEIGLITISKTDDDGFPVELIFSHEATPSEILITEIRSNSSEDRLRVYNKIQSVLSTKNNGIDEDVKDQFQRAAISQVTESWSVKDVIIFSHMFGMPLGSSGSDKERRKEFISQLDDKLIEEIFLDNPELLMTYREMMEEPLFSADGNLILEVPKTNIKSFLINMSFDSQFSKAIEGSENAINSGNDGRISKSLNDLDKIIESDDYEELISDLDMKKEEALSKAYFMAILTDIRNDPDDKNLTSNAQILSKWDSLTKKAAQSNDFVTVIGDLLVEQGKDKDDRDVDLYDDSFKRLDHKGRNQIINFLNEHNTDDSSDSSQATGSIYDLQTAPDDLLAGLLEVAVTRGQAVERFSSMDRQTRSTLQIDIIKEMFGKLLARSKDENEFGLDLKNIIKNSDKLENALESSLYPSTSPKLKDQLTTAMVSLAKMKIDKDTGVGDKTSVQSKVKDQNTAQKLINQFGIDENKFKAEAMKANKGKPSPDGRTAIGKFNQILAQEQDIDVSIEKRLSPVNQVRDNFNDVTKDLDNFFDPNDLTAEEEIFMTDLSTKNQEIRQASMKIDKLKNNDDDQSQRKIQIEEGRMRQIIKAKIRNIDKIIPQTILDIDQLTIEEINSDVQVAEIVKRSSNDRAIAEFQNDYPNLNEKNLFHVRNKLSEELERMETIESKKDMIYIGEKEPMPIKYEASPFKPKDISKTNLTPLKRLKGKPKS